MSTELRPLGAKCNLACAYCYQAPVRTASAGSTRYDIDAMLRAADEIGRPLTVFGGEPLLLPMQDLERIFKFGLDRFGGSSIQTNGSMIGAGHIALFRRYSVRVGVSVDGPGALNALRWAHSLDNTASATAKSLAAIRSLCRANVVPSVIITLHKANAVEQSLEDLVQWLRDLEHWGVTFIRLHLLESESAQIRERFSLNTEEAIAALNRLYELERQLQTLRFDIFDDLRSALDPDGSGADTCVWNSCDPYTTPAVQGVEGDGSRSNCGRTNKEGIEFMKAATPGYERYLVLYHTPQDFGGCSGCRFFLACQGQCPGTAIDGDWRNRTEHCEVWKAVLEQLEREFVASGRTPLSLAADRRKRESDAMKAWRIGVNARSIIRDSGVRHAPS